MGHSTFNTVNFQNKFQKFFTEAAHKKGSGSTKNGRDSISKRRGVKVFGGQNIVAGGIIVRQISSKLHAGNNVGCGNDYTLFALKNGTVLFERLRGKNCVSVYPNTNMELANEKIIDRKQKILHHNRRKIILESSLI